MYKMYLGLYLFLLRKNILRKKLTSFYAESKCADLTKQYNNMELNTFRKAPFLASNFLSDLIV